MKLVTLEKQDGVYARQARTLDAAWVQAEVLGKVGVETAYSGAYRSTIQFNSPGGSTIFAHGTGKTPLDALEAGIGEAVALGARGA